MRGLDITPFTAPLDLLVRDAKPPCRTVCIGDGGNEIGMLNMKDLVKKYVPNGEILAANIGCNHLISAGFVMFALI